MIQSLSLHDFRNYEKKIFEFFEKNVVFFGGNGRGKTNVLEAISILSTGKSWREVRMADVIREGAESSLLEALDERQNHFRATLLPRSRSFFRNEKKIPQHEFSGQIPTLLFAPEHLHLFADVKRERQRFFDRILEQIEPSFSEILSKANKAVAQKNTLLRNFDQNLFSSKHFSDQVEVWNEILAETVPQIIERRKFFLATLNPLLQTELSLLSGKEEEIFIELHIEEKYEPTRTGILRFFDTQKQREIGSGRTLIGPHRDDFLVSFRGKPILSTASRGEERSVVLALLSAEKKIFFEKMHRSPILLLDDVFSELDQSRQNYLENLCDGSQIFFTTTHQEHFENFGKPVQKIEIA